MVGVGPDLYGDVCLLAGLGRCSVVATTSTLHCMQGTRCAVVFRPLDGVGLGKRGCRWQGRMDRGREGPAVRYLYYGADLGEGGQGTRGFDGSASDGWYTGSDLDEVGRRPGIGRKGVDLVRRLANRAGGRMTFNSRNARRGDPFVRNDKSGISLCLFSLRFSPLGGARRERDAWGECGGFPFQ